MNEEKTIQKMAENEKAELMRAVQASLALLEDLQAQNPLPTNEFLYRVLSEINRVLWRYV
jgi:hypothetical protein